MEVEKYKVYIKKAQNNMEKKEKKEKPPVSPQTLKKSPTEPSTTPAVDTSSTLSILLPSKTSSSSPVIANEKGFASLNSPHTNLVSARKHHSTATLTQQLSRQTKSEATSKCSHFQGVP